MIKSSAKAMLDELDKDILRALQEDGRISLVELGKRVKLSTAATHARVRQLEKRGFIQRYAAIVSREKIGYDLLCFIHISLRLHQPHEMMMFLDEIGKMPEVLECYKVTGEHDIILKVLVKNHHDYERFWMEKLTKVPGVAKTHTAIVVNEIKESGTVPIE
jgi:DNA-binding Lrp family transcriptional regulator